MARVSRRPVSAFARRASSRAAHKTARRHKVIMESITQEKKKLRSVISFEAKAPPGYTFIPAGNPHLTTACKELCRKDGLKIFAVSTTPHMHTHNLSQHVHRIGYHFPSAVVANACMELGVYLTATGKAVPFQEINNAQPRKRADSEMSQITINTEARDVLKDLFPNIPDNDLNQIIKTAFQKGQRKVGTAVELPLARRAQLAVVAHIRHVYTNYDKLLKMTSFHEARSLVEEHTLAKLVEWRGDDENGKTVLEDVFREVIVISDDDDSDAEEDVPKPSDRDYSVEVISSQPRVEVLQTQPANTANSGPQDLSEDDVPPGFRVIPRDPKRSKVDRRGFSRYQAWDRAINRYRNVAMGNSQQGSHMSPRDPNLPYGSGQSIQAPIELDLEHFPQRGQSSPHHGNKALNRGGDSPNAPVFVSGPKEVFQKTLDYPGHYSRTSGPSYKEHTSKLQDHVLPSIEAPLPADRQLPETGTMDHLAKRMSGVQENKLLKGGVWLTLIQLLSTTFASFLDLVPHWWNLTREPGMSQLDVLYQENQPRMEPTSVGDTLRRFYHHPQWNFHLGPLSRILITGHAMNLTLSYFLFHRVHQSQQIFTTRTGRQSEFWPHQ
ncbi:hypothetical protein HFD88_003337 [Aspergillus terreus]|nr:hypothetical protein HFD88_003337 [Aspergillus terreus]